MTKYNLKFLEEKLGTFQKEYQYPTKPISGFNLIYIEAITKNELDDIKNKIKEEINPGYIWGYVKNTESAYVTRAFGENKTFNYNPESFKNKTDYVKGKLQVLNNLSENTINDLFDQKAVFDHFYKKLWDLRLDLAKEIRDKNSISDNKALMAAQHIIDRIIFTYFICEKDLITLNGQTTLKGKTLFNSIAKMPEPWKCLKNLFFEQFAKKESKKLLLGQNAQIITPYLNGGLFRPKTIEKISELDLIIEYSKEQWQELFEPLNKYTWIIEDEIQDPVGEYEGNLTPEIIGHIYEKFVITMETLDEIRLEELNISKKGDLKRGNKKIGAYYTPETITTYLSKNTIQSHLLEKLGIYDKNDLITIFDNLTEEKLQKSLAIINDIKICDPSCGSGAFLIKAGELLLGYKIQVLRRLNKEIDLYSLKKDIIIKNLYGIDIQDGAVEICKLRLWLWLISSSFSDSVEPLPNIEYNITVGNSLIGWTNEKLEQNVLLQLDEKVFWVLDALNIHYDANKIDDIKDKLNKTDMRSYAEGMSLLKNLYSYSTEDEAEKLKDIIENIKSVIYDKINGIFYNYLRSKNLKMSYKEFKEFLTPFHWRVDFYDVFENGGFDVIIGNPPYLRIQTLKKRSPDEVNYYKSLYKSAKKGNYDIYVVFVEKGLKLLTKKGKLGYILPSKFFTTDYGETLRELLTRQEIIDKIIDFGHSQVFGNATTYTCLLLLDKSNTKRVIYEKADPISLNQESKRIEILHNQLGNKPWKFLDSKSQDLLKKIKINTNTLLDLNAKISRGVSTGADPIFCLIKEGNILKNKLGEVVDIEKEILRIPLYATDFNRYSFNPNKEERIIFPYDVFQDDYRIIEEKILSKKYPKAFNYLLSKKEELEGRSQYKDWYGFSAPRNLHIHDNADLIIPLLADKGRFTLAPDNINKYCIMASAGFSISLVKTHDSVHLYILGLLNSKLIFWNLKLISNKFRGGWITCTKQYFGTLPIKVVDSKSGNLEQFYDIIREVNNILKLYNQFNDSFKQVDKELINEKIDSGEQRIDKLVYDMYNVNKEEIKIVESNKS